jgi:signal transduction histidine kinase/CheY-like chemotaxis protein
VPHQGPQRDAQVPLTSWWAPILVALVSVGATLISANYIQRLADEDCATQERESIQRIYAHVSELFQEYTNALHMVAGFARASEFVSYNDWKTFVNESRLKHQHPGVWGFGYIERVEPDETDRFVASMHAQGVDDFAIKNHPNSTGTNPDDHLYVIKYEEPESRNRNAWGLNAASDPVNKAVYDKATDTGEPALSHPFRLIQQNGDVHLGAIMVVPLYQRGIEVNTPEERRAHSIGWCAVVLDFQHFFAAELSPSWDNAYINVSMRDPDGHPVNVFRDTPESATAHDAYHYVSFPITLAGGEIDLGIVIDPDTIWSAHTAHARIVTGVGLIVAFLLTTITWLITRSRSHACALAERITKALRERESQQRELADRAQAANLAKSMFLANMSHEIRTPMSAILGYADVLDDATRSTELAAHVRQPVEHIRRAGHHLLSIINDILDLSKIESGKCEIHPLPAAPAEIAAQVTTTLKVRADEKHLSLSWTVADTLPESVMLDDHRVNQILMNLIGNAIKFTNEGSVRLEIDRADDHILFRVADTGIGIEPGSIESVFNPFEQADASMTRTHQGTGLGLSISRSLAHQMGGTLTAQSEPGKGSVFTLALPLVPALDDAGREEATRKLGIHDARAAIVADLPGAAARVLVVEDGEDNRKLIEHYLTRAGHEPVFAAHGQDALDLLDHDDRFDLIIMDMQMPVLDGYVATPELRTRGCTIPIIALTAHAMEHDRQRCLDVGCDEYLSKPIDRQALLRTINTFLARGNKRSAA